MRPRFWDAITPRMGRRILCAVAWWIRGSAALYLADCVNICGQTGWDLRAVCWIFDGLGHSP